MATAKSATSRERVVKGRFGYPSPETTDAFRVWLKAQLERVPKSINAIEAEAGVRGNALGKFLRGERGKAGLTPLQVKRLAPIIGISEERMLSEAGHLSHPVGSVSIEGAVLADQSLDYEDKRFLLSLYRKMASKGGNV